MKIKNEITSTSLSNIFMVLLINSFIALAFFVSTISALYILPTYHEKLPVTILKRDSQFSSGGLSSRYGGSSGFSYSIIFLTDNGGKITTSAPKKAYDQGLNGLSNLREMNLTLSKFANHPIALNIRSKSTQYSGILKRLIPENEKAFKRYNLIAIPFFGAVVAAVLFWIIVLYLIIKMPTLTRTNWIFHIGSYSLAAITGILLSI